MFDEALVTSSLVIENQHGYVNKYVLAQVQCYLHCDHKSTIPNARQQLLIPSPWITGTN